MDNQPLISQKEYSSIKTMYILAIFFCVITFLEPLGMTISAFSQYPPGYFSTPYMILGYASGLNFTILFLLFCILIPKSSKRNTLLLIALFIYALYPVFVNIFNAVQYMQYANQMQDSSSIRDAQPIVIFSHIRSYTKIAVCVVLSLFFFLKYKSRVIKPAVTNLLIVLIAAWVSYFIFYNVWLMMQNAPKTLFMPWVLYIVAMALLCWIVFQNTRRIQKKYIPLLSAIFVLFIAVYFVVISLMPTTDTNVSPADIVLHIISFLYDLMPIYLMYLVYKSITDYSFYKFFIESNPKELIRAKQYAPGESSVWSQFVTLMRRILWKNNN